MQNGNVRGEWVRVAELDSRRVFRRQDVRRAWELQGKLCKLCERQIPFDLVHGDHIFPHTRGGRTEPENLQALCGSCNLRKGSNPQAVVEEFFDVDRLRPGQAQLREWQTEALHHVWREIEAGQPVLIEACPGAGKTLFALELAYRLIKSGEVSRLLIIVPTRAIADGWAKSASAADPMAPTIPLRTASNWRVTEPIDLNGRVVGAISTYQAMSAMPEMFLAHATEPGHRTLVIFDEVHHAGANSSWGEAAQESFASSARQIVSLSGTPFRTDRDPIAFVRSEGGRAIASYKYGYDKALEDGACRPVEFVEIAGSATFEDDDGETKELSFGDEELSELGERRLLRAALEWTGEGGIASRMIEDANAFLLKLRAQGDTDAGGLVVCVDCDHADQVADYMRHSLGLSGVHVACSQSDDANDVAPGLVIERFRRSSDPWIVAVNMVSEGVDIKRLRTLVYLTNRSTLLSFRQIVGRVVRSDPKNQNDYGRVYVPGDPTLLEMSRTIRAEAPALPKPIVIQVEPGPPVTVDRLEGNSSSRDLETVRTAGETGAVFDTRDREAGSSLVELCRIYVEVKGLTGTSPESLALVAAESAELRAEIEEAATE